MRNAASFLSVLLSLCLLGSLWLFLRERSRNVLLSAELASRDHVAMNAPRVRTPVTSLPEVNLSSSLPLITLSKKGEGPSDVDLSRETSQLKDPHFTFTMNKVRQRQVQRNYSYLLNAIAPADSSKLEAIKSLLVRREDAIGDASAACLRQGIGRDSPAFFAALADAVKDIDNRLAGEFGDQGSEYRRLIGISGAMSIIDGPISGDMAYANQPLTPRQKIQLAEMMTGIHYSMSDAQYRELINKPVNPATGLKPINEALLSEAAGILSPLQLNVLRAYQEEQIAYQDMAKKDGMPPGR
jgi:hypothetical protein